MHGWNHITDSDKQTILSGIKDGQVYGGPYHVEIDPIDVCNADCFFCNSVEFRNGDVLAWERLSPLVDEMIENGLRSFRLAGGGEPTLYKQLPELCDKMSDAGVVLENLTTNGILLKEDKIRKLAQCGPTHFHISLNYANESQYEKFMRIPGNRFPRILENVKTLDEVLKELGTRGENQIHFQFFVHRSTIDDLDQMLDLAIKMPVDTITLRSVAWLEEDEQMRPEDIEKLKSKLAPLGERSKGKTWLMFDLWIDGMGDYCEQIAQELHKDFIGTQKLRPPKIEYCYIGWYSMVIQGTGEVHPCCYLMPEKQIPAFGNVSNNSIQDVWKGEMFTRFRNELKQAMVLRARTPFQGRRFKCTLPMCWASDGCPMASGLADTDFYIDAHEELELIRKQPLNQLAHISASASRAVIDTGKKLAGVE